jgi:hypothetical protein
MKQFVTINSLQRQLSDITTKASYVQHQVEKDLTVIKESESHHSLGIKEVADELKIQ